MAFVSMNSPVDPQSRPREPVHLVLAVESSKAARAVTGPGQELVANLLAALEPDDRLSVVGFDELPTLAFSAAIPGVTDVATVELPTTSAGSKVDLYAGIAAAADALAVLPDFVGTSRIVLLTTGAANAGITDPVRIEELASAIVSQGTPFSVLGLGASFEAALPRSLADVGAGSYAYAENGPDLQRLLTQEAGVRLLPLATDVELRIVPSPGYSVGRMYGARRAVVEDGVAVLRTPALFLGTRTKSSDTNEGRRGGGGGFFVELLADANMGRELGANQPAFRLETRYTSVDARNKLSFDTEVANDLPPGQRPDENWPHFSTPDYGKAYMMLNMYLALRAMVDLYAAGDCGSALGVSFMMEPAVAEWQQRFSDPDIEADGRTMLLLRQNIDESCRTLPVPPSNYEAGCFGL